MELLVFDGKYDACFWVLCADKYFKVRGVPENAKMVVSSSSGGNMGLIHNRTAMAIQA